jgi:hypothetical protein
MATSFRIQELRDGLLVQAKRETELWARLIVAVIAAVFAGTASAAYLGAWNRVFLSIVAGLLGFAAAQSQQAQLKVTNVEFTATGDLGRRVQTPRVVCTADVLRLEFQGESGPFTSKRDGLYALTARRELCLLPFLDWVQAVQVIRAIEEKFPGLAEHWRAQSPTRPPFSRLGPTKEN